MSNGGQTPLDSCGCCETLPALSVEYNDPRQPVLLYRLGTYASFYRRMLSQIQSPASLATPPTVPWTISALSTRSSDDPVIALMDAWAVVADIITFYQERIANEGYLRTATERISILQLARAIGYELNPGVAASTWLSFTVEDVIGVTVSPALPQTPKTPSAPSQGAPTYNPGIVDLPPGTQVMSVPPQGALSQTYETSIDLEARTQWNILLPRLTRPADLALGNGGSLYVLGTRAGFPAGASVVSLPAAAVFLLNADTPALQLNQTVSAVQVQQLFLSGTALGVQVNDRMLLVGQNCVGEIFAAVFVVRNVVSVTTAGMTRVDFSDNPVALQFAPAQFPAGSIPSGSLVFNQGNVNTWVLDVTIDESDLQALLRMSQWDPNSLAALANNLSAPGVWTQGVFTFAAEAAFFGHNAPRWSTLPAIPGGVTDTPVSRGPDPYRLSWDGDGENNTLLPLPSIWTDSQGKPYQDATVFLERSFPQVVADSWMVIEAPSVSATPLRITRAIDKSLADYGLSGRCTGLTLQTPRGAPLVASVAPCVVVEFIAVPLGSPFPPFWAYSAFFIGADGGVYTQSGRAGIKNPVVLPPTGIGGRSFLNAPSAVQGGPSPFEIFAIGADGYLYHQWWNGIWWGWFSLGGGNLANSPCALKWTALNFLDVFAIGVDGNLYHVGFNGIWHSPESMGGASPNGDHLVNSPAAVAWGPSPLEVFAIASDGKLYHQWWFGTWSGKWSGAWSGWWPLGGGNFVGSPSALAWAFNGLDVFVIGSNGNLYHVYFDLGTFSWKGPESLGPGTSQVPLVNSPCAISGGPNTHAIDVFAVGLDGNLHHYWLDKATKSWGPVENVNPNSHASVPFVGSPSAVAFPNGMDVFVSGIDGNLYHTWWEGDAWAPFENLEGAPFLDRKSTAHIQSQQQTLSEFPVTDDIPAGATSLMLNGMVLGMTPGQAIALSGMRSDAPGVQAAEVVLLEDVVHNGGFTTLEFTTGLQYSYSRATLTLSANTVQATNGATIPVPEVLGSGDASQANQSFTLKRTPLTWVSAATPSGSESSLEVRVNDLLWEEAPTLYGLSPNDTCYMLRLADDGTATVTFGDGLAGARLPTGQNNVTASYRTGIGVAGKVAAGSVSILQSRPPGLRAVTNALPGTGGADPENVSSARSNAPLTVLTLDRIVSLEDYEDFAAAFAGIGKAQAAPIWDGHSEVVHITVAGVEGASVDPSSVLYQSLAAAVNAAKDPTEQVRIASYQPVPFNLAASVIINTPTYVAADVLSAVSTALLNYFSFDQRSFAQPVSAAEVIAAIQAVPGVIATDLNQLYRNDDPSGRMQTQPSSYLGAAVATWTQGTIAPAELLVLNPIGFSITQRIS